jgi:hypothetical protein
VGTIVVALAGGKDYSSGSSPTQTVSIIKVLLGALLLLAGAVARTPPSKATPALPKRSAERGLRSPSLLEQQRCC